jgi:hypothetical protein
MPYVEHTVIVNRPARAVFDYLADGMNNRHWRNGVLVIERTSSATIGRHTPPGDPTPQVSGLRGEHHQLTR